MERQGRIALESGQETDVLWECPVQADEVSRDVLRVVRYSQGVPQLEKRYFYLTDRGKWMPGRVRGLTRMDLELILSRLAEISAAFRR
jgi:hypothetical protein